MTIRITFPHFTELQTSIGPQERKVICLLFELPMTIVNSAPIPANSQSIRDLICQEEIDKITQENVLINFGKYSRSEREIFIEEVSSLMSTDREVPAWIVSSVMKAVFIRRVEINGFHRGPFVTFVKRLLTTSSPDQLVKYTEIWIDVLETTKEEFSCNFFEYLNLLEFASESGMQRLVDLYAPRVRRSIQNGVPVEWRAECIEKLCAPMAQTRTDSTC